MTEVHFGSGAEFVRISLPGSYSSEGWAQVEVDVSVHGFIGKVHPYLEARDVEDFTRQLRTLYDSLKGEAALEPLERQFILKLKTQSGGKILLTGLAWSRAMHENKLEFSINIDQSFLPAPLRALEKLASTRAS